jgi:hypothetical protein
MEEKRTESESFKWNHCITHLESWSRFPKRPIGFTAVAVEACQAGIRLWSKLALKERQNSAVRLATVLRHDKIV